MKIQETTNGQLIAHCFLANGKPVYNNYDKYYKGANNSPEKCLRRNLFDDNTCA